MILHAGRASHGRFFFRDQPEAEAVFCGRRSPMMRIAIPVVCVALVGAGQPEAKELKAPPVVTPGAAYSVAPPSDAVVLFDGKSMAGWTTREGKPAAWKVADGTMTVV